MRIHLEVALVLCLCLWIPVAHTQYDVTAPEDLDGSGDDEEFSGSGDIAVPTEASQNTTNALPSTIPPESDSETPTITKQVPVVDTTQTPESHPTSTNIPLVNFDEETTTSYDDIQATSSPAQNPISVEHTTPAISEEETTPSELKEKEEIAVGFTKILTWNVETTTVPQFTTAPVQPADPETSADGAEATTTQATYDGNFENNLVPDGHSKEETAKPFPKDEDFVFENEIKPKSRAELTGSELTIGSSSESSSNESLLERKEVLAGVIAGGVVGLLFAVMLVGLMVYRMKKKDEGSYALDEHKHPSGYQKAQRQEEFLA